MEACVAGSAGSKGTWCPGFKRGRERATPEPPGTQRPEEVPGLGCPWGARTPQRSQKGEWSHLRLRLHGALPACTGPASGAAGLAWQGRGLQGWSAVRGWVRWTQRPVAVATGSWVSRVRGEIRFSGSGSQQVLPARWTTVNCQGLGGSREAWKGTPVVSQAEVGWLDTGPGGWRLISGGDVLEPRWMGG